MNRCSGHIQDPIRAGRGVLYASGSSDVQRDVGCIPYHPKELAIYLDPRSWARTTGIRPQPPRTPNIHIPLTEHEQGTIIYVGWPDFSVIGKDRYHRLVRKAVRALQAGQEVEVGCVGGHGRTGTLLAGILATMERLDGMTAIREVRRRYCSHAIESLSQERLILQYVDGIELPIAPDLGYDLPRRGSSYGARQPRKWWEY